jgi:hypothetical protein
MNSRITVTLSLVTGHNKTSLVKTTHTEVDIRVPMAATAIIKADHMTAITKVATIMAKVMVTSHRSMVMEATTGRIVAIVEVVAVVVQVEVEAEENAIIDIDLFSHNTQTPI